MQRFLDVLGVVRLVVIAAIVGLANWWVFEKYSNTRNMVEEADASVDALDNLMMIIGLVWTLVAGYIYSKADARFDRVKEAVLEENEHKFQRAMVRMVSIRLRMVHLLVTILFMTTLHQYHIANDSAAFQTQFLVAFSLVIAIGFLMDLSSPIGGMVHVPGIPAEWIANYKNNQQQRAEKLEQLIEENE